MILDFSEKKFSWQKYCSLVVFFMKKATLFNFSQYHFVRFFCPSLVFKENSYFVQSETRDFFELKNVMQKFCKIFFLDYSQILCDDTHSSKEREIDFILFLGQLWLLSEDSLFGGF